MSKPVLSKLRSAAPVCLLLGGAAVAATMASGQSPQDPRYAAPQRAYSDRDPRTPSMAPTDPQVIPAAPADGAAANDPTQPERRAQRVRPQPAAPDNPLVMVNPEKTTGNPTIYYDRDGKQKTTNPIAPDRTDKDYRIQPEAPQPNQSKQQRLPLFGYNFFQPARQLITARRSFLQQRYAAPASANANRPGVAGPVSRRPNIGANGNPNPAFGGNRPLDTQNDPFGLIGNPPQLNGYGNGYGATPNAPYALNGPGAGGNYGQQSGVPGQYPSGQYDPRAAQGQYDPNTGQSYGADQSAPNLYGRDTNGDQQDWRTGASSDAAPDNGSTQDSQGKAAARNRAPKDPYANEPANQFQDSSSRAYEDGLKPYPAGTYYPPKHAAASSLGSRGGLAPSSDPYAQNNGAYGNRGSFYDPSLNPNGTGLPYGSTPGGDAYGGAYGDGTGVGGNSARSEENQFYGNASGADQSLTGDSSSNSSAGAVGGRPNTPGDLSRYSDDSVNAFNQISDPLDQLYRNVTASAPANYQLSGGDILTIRYWTPTQASREFSRTVDAQGAVTLEGIGRLVVRGQTLAQAENTLRHRLAGYYKGADVSVTLRELRTIPVTVGGESFAPGTYTVPAVSTVFNILYAAGGPTADGSLRGIEIRRQGKLIGTFDFYSFINGKTPAPDVALQSGDLIYIPPRISRVIVKGEVRQPAIFELKPDERLDDALRYAGGVKPSGVDQRVQVSTVVPGAEHVLRDVNVKKVTEVKAVPLYDGDEVEIFSVRSVLANRVTVEGAVDQPGDYALQNGMHVSDLLERARGPLYNAYLSRADLYRYNSDNTLTLIPVDVEKALAHDPTADVALTRWDRLKLYSRQEVSWTGQRAVTIRGAVQRPGIYYRSDNMSVRDLLLAAGGTLPEAYLGRSALLHQHSDGTFAYDYVNLETLLAGDATQDVKVQDNDVLAVYKIGEAQFEPNHVVIVRGEVVAPGTYPRGEGMRLSDALKLAGGFKPNAGTQVIVTHAHKIGDPPNATLTTSTAVYDNERQTVTDGDLVLTDGDVIAVQGIGGIKDHVGVITVKGAVNHPGPITLTKQLRLSDVLREVGGLRPEAFPEGAEFTRDPEVLETAGQRSLTSVIIRLNDLLNQSAYKREQAKSDIERIKAADTATGNSAIAIPGITGAATPSATATAVATRLSQRDLVTPSRLLSDDDLQSNGNIAVNLPEAMRKPGGSEDILLVDGDTITIPEQPTTIQVVGAVFNSRSVLYKPGAPISYYVEQAGGFAPDSANKQIEIIHAGGGLIPADKVRTLRPGDVVLVPTRVLAEKISRNSNVFNDIFKNILSTALIFKLLR
ncbi:hypothetical protein CCAX7_009290 [Capsulimonas corticalis]|uniref:Uncharacterized protein n=1 Tax=Capsulimonas corticalis TaxID=2219043 RepID=A0A402CU64_9BACT|nr:SLBB domain-containing protein [Capsulimonas corticalis]BDI28878.1 hypothetical protein CCAX7_009290 [Capsulimonas corticalis]